MKYEQKLRCPRCDEEMGKVRFDDNDSGMLEKYSGMVNELLAQHKALCSKKGVKEVFNSDKFDETPLMKAAEKTTCQECGKRIREGQLVSGEGRCEKCNTKRIRKIHYFLTHRPCWWLVHCRDTGIFFALFGKPKSLIEKTAFKYHKGMILIEPEYFGLTEEKLKILEECPKYPVLDDNNISFSR